MNFFIGLTALQTSQYGMDVVAQNLANANTPGYHRQQVHQESRELHVFRGRQYGYGVGVQYVERLRNQITEAMLTDSISDVNQVQQIVDIEVQIETLFLPGDGSLHNQFDALFQEINALAANPGDTTTRFGIVDAGSQLARQFQQVSQSLTDIKQAVRYQLEHEVSILNDQMVELRDLNREIFISQPHGDPNGLLDKRDQLINEIAESIDVQRQERYPGAMSLIFGNHSVQLNPTPTQFSVRATGDKLELMLGDEPLHIGSGRLAGLVEAFNETIPAFEQQLDTLASQFMQKMDQAHATGIGTHGSFGFLRGSRPVEDINVPLVDAGTTFPVEAGELFFSVVDPQGLRTTHSVSIDPSSQSLRDVAASISAIDNLHATVDPQTNQLQISAGPDYTFDFTGSLETHPVLSSFSGTSIPSFGGQYNGDVTRGLQIEIVGSGEIGVTEGLTARILDENGNFLEELNIGLGYEAGTDATTLDGVSLQFSAGSVVDGDSFETRLVANPDETNLLSALGLNSFFEGGDAGDMGVNRLLMDNPSRLASSTTGDAADTTLLSDLIGLQDTRTMSGSRLTFQEYLNETTTDIGVRVQSHQRLRDSLSVLKTRYEEQKNAVSGVDVNEEMVYMTQYQKSYEAAVRVIQTAEAMLDELFTIIR